MTGPLWIGRKELFLSLAWRIALVAAGVSVLVGVLTYRATHREYLQTIDSLAHQGVGRFNAGLLPLLEQPAKLSGQQLQQHLEDYTRERIDYREGRTDVFALYDLNGVKLAEVRNPAAPEQARLPDRVEDIASADTYDLRFHDLDGHPYLTIVRSLENSRGLLRLKAAALFAVSEQVMKEMHQRILRNVLLGVGIVLLTTVLIYPLASSLLQRVQTLSDDLMVANLETLQVLGSAIAKRDSDTDVHNYRVTLYAARLGEKAALGEDEMRELIKGAFLHDVGKIGIHDAILLKPGPLDDEEFAAMKRHVEYGLDIVGRSRWLEDAARVVGNHHEKWDGSGYLHSLAGEDIPISARIFAIADVFDALTVRRPYKNPFNLDMALGILQDSSGSHFDPHLVGIFVDLAPALHQRYAEADKQVLQEELQALVKNCFTTG